MAKQSFLGRSLFWTIMIIFLIIAFGHSSKNYELTFFFVTSLLPIAIATSWFFNHFLVPRYLQPGKYLKFGIYLTYTMIVSLWLEMIIAILAFIFLANYDYANMTPESTNLVHLGLSLYFIVFVDSFRHTFLQMQSRQRKIDQMTTNGRKYFLLVKVDRKNVQVDLEKLLYIESLGDYIKLHTTEGILITRERISKIEEKLPEYYLRIHRSFLVNTKKIDSFSKESITVNSQEIPISRTFKEKAMAYLEAGVEKRQRYGTA